MGTGIKTENLIKACKEKLRKEYGPRFHSLIVYGSYAKGNADKDSDIDLFILINEPFDYFKELKNIVDILYPVQLDSDFLISAKPVFADDFTAGKNYLYRTAVREGIVA